MSGKGVKGGKVGGQDDPADTDQINKSDGEKLTPRSTEVRDLKATVDELKKQIQETILLLKAQQQQQREGRTTSRPTEKKSPSGSSGALTPRRRPTIFHMVLHPTGSSPPSKCC